MRGYGARPARQGRDGERGRIACRIPHGQDRVDGRRFHERHACDLGGPRCPAYDGICQIRAVQRQHQLAGLISAHLK